MTESAPVGIDENGRLPFEAREALAADLSDPETEVGAAVAGAVGALSDPAVAGLIDNPTSGTRERLNATIAAFDAWPKSNPRRWAMFGDSLTRGYDSTGGTDWALSEAWPYKFATEAGSGIDVFNRGVSGQTMDEILIRMGALELIAQSGFTIPAGSDTPVGVTVQSDIGWRPTRTWTFEGSFAGVAGVLTRTTSATTGLTFKRSESGSETVVAPGSKFASAQAVHSADTMVLFAGRNDVSYDVTGPDGSVAEHVLAGFRKAVAYLTPRVKRILLAGPTTSTSETTGTAGNDTVLAIEAGLQDEFPQYVAPVRRYLVDQAIYDLGITPDSTDLTQITGDTLPHSIMLDSVHYSKATAALVGEFLFDQAAIRGWAPIGGAGGPIDPPTSDLLVAGAVAEYTATDLAMGALASWPDNAGGVALSVGGGAPTVTDDAGKRFVRFDGLDDWMTRAMTRGQPHTIYVRFRIQGTFPSSSSFIVASTASSRANFSTAAPTSNVQLYAGASLQASPAIADTNWHTAVVVVNGTSSVLAIDGVETAGDAGAWPGEGLRLAAGPNTPSSFTQVDIAAVGILPHAADVSERADIKAIVDAL